MNGFIYPLFNSIINLLHYTNVVELFKFIAKFYAKLSVKNGEDVSIDTIRSYSTIAIDIYQLFKWGTLIFLWFAEYDNLTSKIIIYYLIKSMTYVFLNMAN